MIQKVIDNAKLSIIERGIVLKAYDILYTKQDDIFFMLNDHFDIAYDEATKNLATLIAFIEANSTLDKRMFGGLFIDFLDRDARFGKSGNNTVLRAFEKVLYETAQENAAGCMMYALDDYASTVYGLSDKGLDTLLYIFENYFSLESYIGSLFDVSSFLEVSGWDKLTTREIIDYGAPLLKNIGKHSNFSSNSLKKILFA